MAVARVLAAALAVVGVASGSPAGAQSADPAATGAVTMAELEGSVVEASVTESRIVRSELGEGEQRAHHIYRVAIGPAASLKYSQSITITRVKKGDSDTRKHTASATLGQPHKFRDGQAVWVLDGATLALLRTQNDGGDLLKLTFVRGAKGMTCSIRKSFAREDGVGGLATTSTNFGAKKVLFLSAKQIGSSCRVTKG